MKSKSFIIFLIILGVLLGIVLVKKSLRSETPTTEQWADIVKEPASANNLTECKIFLGDKKLHLVKKDSKWIVESNQGAFAETQKVENLLNKIDILEGELRSDDKNILADYGINDNEAVQIVLKNASKEISQLLIGTKKAGWNKNFVRSKGSNAVYVIEENILSELGFWGEVDPENFNIDQWTDKSIVHLDEQEIQSVKIEKDGKVFANLIQEVTDDKETWKTVKDYSLKIDRDKISDFVRSITNLKANSIASAEESGEFDQKWKMTIGLNNDKEITLVLGQKDGNNHFLKASDKNYYFKVPQYSFKNIDKTDGDFFANNPLDIKEDAITSIHLNDMDAKIEITALKSEEDTSIWKSKSDEIFNADDIESVWDKLKNTTLKTLPEKSQSLENSLIIKMGINDNEKELIFSKEFDLSEGIKGHYLEIINDDQVYFVESNKVLSITSAIEELDKNKSKEEPKEKAANTEEGEEKNETSE